MNTRACIPVLITALLLSACHNSGEVVEADEPDTKGVHLVCIDGFLWTSGGTPIVDQFGAMVVCTE